MTFDEALVQARHHLRGDRKSFLLIGNGFCRAYDNNIFSYEAILKNATFKRHGAFIRRVFAILKTSDFERVIRLFVEMRLVLESLPRSSKRLLDFLLNVEQSLKEALAETLAKNHPDGLFVIPEVEYFQVDAFLNHFESVYSLNYDLLLYWARMHSLHFPTHVDDGFRNPDDPNTDYVTWEPENRYNQCIFYLHGALHIFDSGSEMRKFTRCRTGTRLKDQILVELQQNNFPIIITEGTSEAKKAKIFHNIYLASAYKSLIAKGGAMFIHGASLQEHDAHILRAIRESKVKAVFIGLFGDPANESNTQTFAHAREWLDSREFPKALYAYDVQSTKVWR